MSEALGVSAMRWAEPPKDAANYASVMKHFSAVDCVMFLSFRDPDLFARIKQESKESEWPVYRDSPAGVDAYGDPIRWMPAGRIGQLLFNAMTAVEYDYDPYDWAVVTFLKCLPAQRRVFIVWG